MDFKDKYFKYKNKYIQLKNESNRRVVIIQNKYFDNKVIHDLVKDKSMLTLEH